MVDGPIVELKGVGLQFGSLVIHRNISFQVRAGETVTILGPSGSGKTLILKMIMGLISPTKGEVIVMNSSLNRMSEDERRKIRIKTGMLFQGAALFDSLSVYENIAYSLRELREDDEATIKKIVSEKLEVIGLPGIEQKFPPQLSGGQKKRVGLARALASSPEIMLFDEPTTGLDPTATKLIDDLIIKLGDNYNITSIAVTHDIESAKRISDRWILIDNGEIAADGSVQEVLKESKEVRDFVSGNWRDE